MESTRIAIATADGTTVCDHLARASAFVVVEVDSGVPVFCLSAFICVHRRLIPSSLVAARLPDATELQ
jgi:hypothetical protein